MPIKIMELKNINVNSKLKDIDFPIFKEATKIMLRKIWMDSGVKIDKDLFEHTHNSLSYSLHNYHSTLLFAEIQAIFKGISLGQYKCTRISANSILGALNEYLEVKRKRVAMEGDLEHQKNKAYSNYIYDSGLPVGSALLFKMEQREKGIYTFENMPLKEIAEKIKAGELKITTKRKNKSKY